MTIEAAKASVAGGDAILLAFFEQYAANYVFAKPGGVWCYEDGCVYRGLLELHAGSGEERWRDHVTRLLDQQLGADGTLKGYRAEEFNIDNILAGRVLFAFMQDGDQRFRQAADQLAGQLRHHPRTQAGNYWHKKIYPHQVWLDGLYMGLPFQIEYGLRCDAPDMVEDALNQLFNALRLMRDPETGLYFHGYDESRQKDWADPVTGLSKSVWSRAMGWLAMALVDCVALLPLEHPRRAELARVTTALCEIIIAYRTANNVWLQVMDMPNLQGNYEEMSASAMFSYSLLRCGRVLAKPEFATAGKVALEAITAQHVSQDETGRWLLNNVCEVAGLGSYRDRNRDGTPEYYVSEKVVANDPKGVGPLMMALGEELRV